MKTDTLPTGHVEPARRAEVEAVLVERQRAQDEFLARGLRSRDEAKRTGAYVDADVVLERLQRKLDAV